MFQDKTGRAVNRAFNLSYLVWQADQLQNRYRWVNSDDQEHWMYQFLGGRMDGRLQNIADYYRRTVHSPHTQTLILE